MSIRREPIYISRESYRSLWLIGKANPNPESRAILTPDEIADVLLKKALSEWYPELLEGLKELDKKEKELIESLRHEKTVD